MAAWRRAAGVAGLLWLAAAGPAARPPASIGMAQQEPDGTIVLTLRAELPGGGVGDAQIRYPPSDPHYREVARHVGPIPHGGSVLVRPFDDPPRR